MKTFGFIKILLIAAVAAVAAGCTNAAAETRSGAGLSPRPHAENDD